MYLWRRVEFDSYKWNFVGKTMLKRFLILLSLIITPFTSQAALIDFTDASWSIVDGNSVANIGNVTLSSTGGLMSFNGWDNGGCIAGQGSHGLACDGDGIGIRNDEITELGNTRTAQTIKISFDNAVNISNLFLLDLFGNEQTGEVAIIDGNPYQAPVGNLGIAGGYFATGFTGLGITEIILSGNRDFFSDYAVAGIEVSPVPLPGAVFLFGSALLGFFGFRRFSK